MNAVFEVHGSAAFEIHYCMLTAALSPPPPPLLLLLPCPQLVSYAAQQGVGLSRARVHFFRHNDMEDLERCLKEVDEEDKTER